MDRKPDIKLVRALQKDFTELYQKEYTTEYKTKRMLINIELGIMRLDNLEKYIINRWCDQELRRVLKK